MYIKAKNFFCISILRFKLHICYLLYSMTFSKLASYQLKVVLEGKQDIYFNIQYPPE